VIGKPGETLGRCWGQARRCFGAGLGLHSQMFSVFV
jgi:hypothetical protein